MNPPNEPRVEAGHKMDVLVAVALGAKWTDAKDGTRELRFAKMGPILAHRDASNALIASPHLLPYSQQDGVALAAIQDFARDQILAWDIHFPGTPASAAEAYLCCLRDRANASGSCAKAPTLALAVAYCIVIVAERLRFEGPRAVAA